MLLGMVWSNTSYQMVQTGTNLIKPIIGMDVLTKGKDAQLVISKNLEKIQEAVILVQKISS